MSDKYDKWLGEFTDDLEDTPNPVWMAQDSWNACKRKILERLRERIWETEGGHSVISVDSLNAIEREF